MASHVVQHMDKYDLLYDLQHGFREKRSCETQLATLVGDLASTSAGKHTDLVLLDFSKAFDGKSLQAPLKAPSLRGQRKFITLDPCLSG